MDYEKFKKTIVKRAYRLKFDNVYSLIENKPFILAGGALGAETPKDFDIYPVNGFKFEKDSIVENLALFDKDAYKFIMSTRNAITVKADGQVIQFCSYAKNSVQELIKSFDFAHCQIGVYFDGCGEPPHPNGVYYTDDYITSQLCGGTFYTGSEYPLSSLFRTIKYASRGKFSGKGHIDAIFRILSDVVKRRFRDYDDFKDQLDAIDLGLAEYAEAYKLFKVLEERNMVESHEFGE